jgi:hypothetical protein
MSHLRSPYIDNLFIYIYIEGKPLWNSIVSLQLQSYRLLWNVAQNLSPAPCVEGAPVKLDTANPGYRAGSFQLLRIFIFPTKLSWLVVSTYPSEKWWSEFVSWADDIPKWMESHSKFHGSKPPTRYIVVPIINHY